MGLIEETFAAVAPVQCWGGSSFQLVSFPLSSGGGGGGGVYREIQTERDRRGKSEEE
ncbi:unnamed protein product, partial [Citrullus colocynthis]